MQGGVLLGEVAGYRRGLATQLRQVLNRGTCLVGVVVVLCIAGIGSAAAQHFEVMNGPPVQMQPYVDEPGAPHVTVPLGTPVPFAGLDSGLGGGGSSGPPSEALSAMLATPWGAQAAQNAQTAGINPSALAATCVMETNCGTNMGNGQGAQGVFQMFPAAFHDGLAEALRANPQLASQVNSTLGPNDPTTAAIASIGYLMLGAKAVQAAGISNPTFADVRSTFQFGPSSGVAVATTSSDQLVSSVVSLTPQQYRSNGIDPATTTIGAWRQTVTQKVGTAAVQPVLM